MGKGLTEGTEETKDGDFRGSRVEMVTGRPESPVRAGTCGGGGANTGWTGMFSDDDISHTVFID